MRVYVVGAFETLDQAQKIVNRLTERGYRREKIKIRDANDNDPLDLSFDDDGGFLGSLKRLFGHKENHAPQGPFKVTVDVDESNAKEVSNVMSYFGNAKDVQIQLQTEGTKTEVIA